jgi:hypothetical protein
LAIFDILEKVGEKAALEFRAYLDTPAKLIQSAHPKVLSNHAGENSRSPDFFLKPADSVYF